MMDGVKRLRSAFSLKIESSVVEKGKEAWRVLKLRMCCVVLEGRCLFNLQR